MTLTTAYRVQNCERCGGKYLGIKNTNVGGQRVALEPSADPADDRHCVRVEIRGEGTRDEVVMAELRLADRRDRRPKSEKGWRKVSLPTIAYDYLDEHSKLPERANWVTGDLIFGRTRTQAFTPAVITKRADAAWKAAGLEKRLTLHEARHCYASLALAAGLAIDDLRDSLGHGSYSITMDRYAHRVPGANTIAAEKMNAHF